MTGDDRAAGLALVREMLPVSRETETRLDQFVGLLRRWQRAKNLVGPETLATLWTRHVADSAQALAVLPQARRWTDLGSGAGFPGLVLAILLAGEEAADVRLVESNGRKCAFLRAAARETAATATVHCARIEDFVGRDDRAVDAVSARALAPLPDLLRLAAPLIARGAVGVFHKGQDVERELTESSRYWRIDADLVPSRTHSSGSILVVRDCVAKSA